MAKNKEIGLKVLQSWIPSLSLTRGLLLAYDDDENNTQMTINDFNDNQAVYIKYYATDAGETGDILAGDAYMKPYRGDNIGVIFQPKLKDGEFRQYGDFPLDIF